MNKNKNKHAGTTRLVHSGRLFKDYVNTPVTRAATILFDSIEHMDAVEHKRMEGTDLYYGRYGTSSTIALCDALAAMENADRAVIYPSGVAAIVGAIMPIVQPGDHILMTEGVYPNARRFAETMLRRINVDITYYDPLIGSGIDSLIQPNTKIIYMESPASATFEFQDVPAIVATAKQHGIRTIIDNTWATGLRFRPLDLGVDLSIVSATKHIAGHSDVMMGVVTGRGGLMKNIFDYAVLFGYCVGADDAYLALRGLRTLPLRMNQSESAAKQIAAFIKSRGEVVAVLHPDFDCANAPIFKRDFSGGCGVFGFVLNPRYDDAAVARMIEHLELFGLGFSWGGFESLIMPQNPTRAHSKTPKGKLIRLSVGFEDATDLISDLEQGFAQL